MRRIKAVILLVIRDQHQTSRLPGLPTWPVFLAYLIYQRAICPQRLTKSNGPPNWLIYLVGFLLAILIVAAVAPERIGDVVRHWPVIP